MSLRYLTAGESHGKALVGIIDGLPAGLALEPGVVNHELQRRQKGYGRGGRMKIEQDRVEILSGVRHGRTLGGPVALLVHNRDWENWESVMTPEVVDDDAATGNWRDDPVTRPRPGHADLAGGLKYRHTDDLRNVLERASARETAMRVAVGAVARQLLRVLGIEVFGHVVQLGSVRVDPFEAGLLAASVGYHELRTKSEASPVRCVDEQVGLQMVEFIKRMQREGDSVGGVFEVLAVGVPPGLGSHVQWDRKLDGQLAAALMSIQAMKAVEVGLGVAAGGRTGSQVHDEIFHDEKRRFFRKTNRAGGIEGGTSNGEPVVVRATMKPIPTLYKPLRSVDVVTKEPFEASVERSDVCALPAASVVGENVVAQVLANAVLDKFGGDHVDELRSSHEAYLRYLGGV